MAVQCCIHAHCTIVHVLSSVNCTLRIKLYFPHQIVLRALSNIPFIENHRPISRRPPLRQCHLPISPMHPLTSHQCHQRHQRQRRPMVNVTFQSPPTHHLATTWTMPLLCSMGITMFTHNSRLGLYRRDPL